MRAAGPGFVSHEPSDLLFSRSSVA